MFIPRRSSKPKKTDRKRSIRFKAKLKAKNRRRRASLKRP